jgi:hypothetical protein
VTDRSGRGFHTAMYSNITQVAFGTNHPLRLPLLMYHAFVVLGCG